MGVGLIVAGVVAAGAAAYAANEQSNAAAGANATNKKNMEDTNRLNYKMFLQSRGAGGSAILPLYFKKHGKPFEKQLSRDAMNEYNMLRSRSSPRQLINRTNSAISLFKPAQAGAQKTVGDIFSGALRDESLANFRPLAAQRLESADAMRDAGMMALAEEKSRADAEAGRQGFTGSTFGNKLLSAELTRKTFQDAALRESAAKEANAGGEFDIDQTDINRRLGNLYLPYAMTQQKVNISNLPENVALDQAARRQQLLNWFKLQPGQFQYQPMPTVQPVASTGQIVAQGVSSAAGAVGNYYAQKKLADQMNAGGGNPYGNSAPQWYQNYLDAPINDPSISQGYG